jgi:hypothetical protein
VELLREEIAQLTATVADQAQTIEQLEAVIAQLKRQMDLERRYLIDSQARSFKSWLLKQPSTPVIRKMLAEPFFADRAAHWTYEAQLRLWKYSEEELLLFKDLWKAMLLESSSGDN